MDPKLIDILWLVTAAGLVFLMQAGFLCLEAGLTRTKNSINVAIKNMADFGISALVFWVLGFGLMFGATWHGWIGGSLFASDFPATDGGWTAAFFLYQLTFCGATVTIVSGAVAERIKFTGYLMMALTVALVYPVFGHWAWAGGLLDQGGWLGEIGFIDFAGSTVVHGVGGWFGLAACLVVGARLGRFNDDGTVNQTNGSNVPFAMLGAMILWFGWIGFNGGSTLALDASVPGVLVNTMLAGAAGLCVSMAACYRLQGYGHPTAAINGTLAGLVAITANCHAVSAAEAVLIGSVGALVAHAVQSLLYRLKIDDVISAVPVHLAAGVWGTLAVALFGDLGVLGTGLTRVEQLGVQALGIGVCGALCLGVGLPVFWALHRTFGLRVSEEAERDGLNYHEHHATTELMDFAYTIERQATTGDLTLRAPVEPFTEIGQIAQRYNGLMEQLAATTMNVDELNSMTANVPGMVYRFEMDATGSSRFTFVSAGCKQFYGLEPQELIHDAEAFGSAIMGDELASFTENVGQSWQNLTPFHWIGRLRHLDGSVRWIEARSNPERLADGTTRWDGVMTDISEAKQTAEEMKKLSLVASKTDNAVIITDARGHIEWVNAGFTRITEYTLDDVIGKKPGSFLQGPKTRPETVVKIREALARGEAVSDEIMNYSKTGRPYWLGIDIQPVRNTPDGPVTHFIAIEREVTERKAAEAQLRKAMHDANAANEAKSEFLANMSHEIRTPLHGILSFARFGIKKADAGDLAKLRDYFTKINTSGERLLELVNDLLDIAKLESGKMDFEFAPHDLAKLVNAVVDEHLSLVSERGIKVCFAPPTRAIEARVDQRKLMQVVRNLMGNAIKFSPADQAVEVALGRSPEGAIRITVRDHGPGIPEDELKLIFDKFIQSSKTKSGAGGTGLGLAITTEIVKGHGGRVWAENHPECGAVFTVELPPAAAAKGPAERRAAA